MPHLKKRPGIRPKIVIRNGPLFNPTELAWIALATCGLLLFAYMTSG